MSRGCVNQSIWEMKIMLKTVICSLKRDRLVNWNNVCLAKRGNSQKGFLLSYHFLDFLVDFVKHNNRCDDIFWRSWFNKLSVLSGLGSFREPFNPSKAIDADQSLSDSSRRSFVSSPGMNPSVSLIGRTGMYWMIPCLVIATILSPGFIPDCFRSFSGITIWYFFETVTVSIVN